MIELVVWSYDGRSRRALIRLRSGPAAAKGVVESDCDFSNGKDWLSERAVAPAFQRSREQISTLAAARTREAGIDHGGVQELGESASQRTGRRLLEGGMWPSFGLVLRTELAIANKKWASAGLFGGQKLLGSGAIR
jgi:hypothetical protein